MTRIALTTAAALFLATSASAGSFGVSLPNLTFPADGSVVVSKDCLASDATSDVCLPQE